MWSHGVLIESARIAVWQGVVAGLCGGVAMAVAMALLSTAVGEGPWQLPRRLAGIVLGPERSSQLPAILLGYAVHFALSAGFGALFAIVADNLTHEFWMTSLAYGLTLWLINYWGSAITPGGRETMELKTAWLSPIAHIAYGAGMAAIAVTFAAAGLRAS